MPPKFSIDQSHAVHIIDNSIPQYNVPNKPSPYKWDGKTRPNIDDYISPWIDTASQHTYKYAFSKAKRLHNAAVVYAQNQLKAATAQYDNDVAFWNEQDERNYTSQLSQAQRYEDAGFNLGYLYNQVDNGNNAVGYSQNDSQFEPEKNEYDNLSLPKLVADIAIKCLSFVKPFIEAGISLAKLPKELALLSSQIFKADMEGLKVSADTTLSNERMTYQRLQNDFLEALQSFDKDGNRITNLTESLQFTSEALSYKLKDAQFTDMSKWNEVASKIYELQSTPTADEAYNNWVMQQDMPQWCKVLCIVLGSFVSKVTPSIGITKTHIKK